MNTGSIAAEPPGAGPAIAVTPRPLVPDDAPALDVAKALGEDIIFGRLAPGTRLVEDHLIARFGATRHYIRQALYELERTGIVVREKNKGVAVRSLTPAEVRQIYEVRELLQRQAALRIVLPVPATAIAELERLHDAYARHLRERDFTGVHDVNDRFHLTLFACCGNAYLVDSIKHYMWLSLPVRAKKTADLDRALASEHDHFHLIQLLKGTDSWALAQLCVDHLQPAKEGYLTQVAMPSPGAVSSTLPGTGTDQSTDKGASKGGERGIGAG